MSNELFRGSPRNLNSAAGTSNRLAEKARAFSFLVEPLESRTMLSGVSPLNIRFGPDFTVPVGFTPGDIRQAYSLNNLTFPSGISANGAGQTIAIVDAYLNDYINQDAQIFNTTFNLPQFNTGGPRLQVFDENANTPPTVEMATNGPGWAVEEALDVEWAHVVAPQANIDLVVANTQTLPDLFATDRRAARLPGVSVVSNSWGAVAGEFPYESYYDANFVTPPLHQGVTFVFASGDSGIVSYPAASPNVLSVGGTSLILDPYGNYQAETAWSLSGGGTSLYESLPSYQSSRHGITGLHRETPDVSWLADPATGVAVVDVSNMNKSPWGVIGGTSLACPMWAGLLAIVNQGRVASGQGTMDGPSQTLPLIYQLPTGAFHDVTVGANLVARAGPGYDEVTGLGTPIASILIPDMLTHLVFQVEPGTSTAGAPINPFVVVEIENGDGQILSSFQFGITISLVSGPGTLSGTLSATTLGGIATFTDLVINQAGAGYQLGAGFTNQGVSITSNQFNVVSSAASFDAAEIAIIDSQGEVNPTPDVTVVSGSQDEVSPAGTTVMNNQTNYVNSTTGQNILSDNTIVSPQQRLENAFRLLIAGTESEIANLQTPNLVPVKLAPNQQRFASGARIAAQPAKGVMLLDDVLIASLATVAFKSNSDRKKRKAE